MAPFGLALFGDSGDPSLPDTIQPSTRGVDTAFERFIDGALTKLYNESSSRTEDGRALRASCKPLLGAHPSPTHMPCHISVLFSQTSVPHACSVSRHKLYTVQLREFHARLSSCQAISLEVLRLVPHQLTR